MICSSEGDLGDATYLLCILKELPGGPHTLLLQQSTVTKARGREGIDALVRLFAPLARSQSYVKECRENAPGEAVDWESAKFRTMGHYKTGRTLLGAHVDHLIKTKGVGQGITGATPWLKVKPSAVAKGRIVVNRTGRYRNNSFPWPLIVQHYKHRLLFVGLHHEWREFCGHFGYVDYQPTADLLELAQVIAGSELFIGNQSCSFAIAEGLKHPRIQETDPVVPDCVYPGNANAQYSADGAVLLPDVEGSGELQTPSHYAGFREAHPSETPPGKWQYPGLIPQFSLGVMATQVAKEKGVPLDEASRLVYTYNCERVPDYFRRTEGDSLFRKVTQAKINAGL